MCWHALVHARGRSLHRRACVTSEECKSNCSACVCDCRGAAPEAINSRAAMIGVSLFLLGEFQGRGNIFQQARSASRATHVAACTGNRGVDSEAD